MRQFTSVVSPVHDPCLGFISDIPSQVLFLPLVRLWYVTDLTLSRHWTLSQCLDFTQCTAGKIESHSGAAQTCLSFLVAPPSSWLLGVNALSTGAHPFRLFCAWCSQLHQGWGVVDSPQDRRQLACSLPEAHVQQRLTISVCTLVDA